MAAFYSTTAPHSAAMLHAMSPNSMPPLPYPAHPIGSYRTQHLPVCQCQLCSACAHENEMANTGAGGFAATPPSCIALCATTALSFRPHPAAACVCVREPWWAGLGRASARTLYVGLMRLVNPTGGSQMQAALHAAGRPRPRRRARAYTLPVLSPFRWNVRMPARLG